MDEPCRRGIGNGARHVWKGAAERDGRRYGVEKCGRNITLFVTRATPMRRSKREKISCQLRVAFSTAREAPDSFMMALRVRVVTAARCVAFGSRRLTCVMLERDGAWILEPDARTTENRLGARRRR
jgi:hypothetical protein